MDFFKNLFSIFNKKKDLSKWKFHEYITDGIEPLKTESKKDGKYYEVYSANSRVTANCFLGSIPYNLITPGHYIIVETPEGNLGKDMEITFNEPTGEVISRKSDPVESEEEDELTSGKTLAEYEQELQDERTLRKLKKAQARTGKKVQKKIEINEDDPQLIKIFAISEKLPLLADNRPINPFFPTYFSEDKPGISETLQKVWKKFWINRLPSENDNLYNLVLTDLDLDFSSEWEEKIDTLPLEDQIRFWDLLDDFIVKGINEEGEDVKELKKTIDSEKVYHFSEKGLEKVGEGIDNSLDNESLKKLISYEKTNIVFTINSHADLKKTFIMWLQQGLTLRDINDFGNKLSVTSKYEVKLFGEDCSASGFCTIRKIEKGFRCDFSIYPQ